MGFPPLRRLPSFWVATCLALGLSASAFAVTPGVDIAAPRVATVIINSGFVFTPSQSAVEQGDYVLWNNIGAGSHTSTSGNPCMANGLWNFPLGAGVQAQRQFIEAPGSQPYFCTPHCGLGMTGMVRVTTRISLQVSDNAGTAHLSWTGGGPTYKVFATTAPTFNGAPPMTPVGGDTGTSFDDPTIVSVGQTCYWLVMNK